jgi:cytoskeletal protein RodZ
MEEWRRHRVAVLMLVVIGALGALGWAVLAITMPEQYRSPSTDDGSGHVEISDSRSDVHCPTPTAPMPDGTYLVACVVGPK